MDPKDLGDVVDALEFAALCADDEADAIRRGYSSGTKADIEEHLGNAVRWRELAAKLTTP